MIGSPQERNRIRTIIGCRIREMFLAAITERSDTFNFGLFYGYVSALHTIGFITLTQYMALTTACNKRRWANDGLEEPCVKSQG